MSQFHKIQKRLFNIILFSSWTCFFRTCVYVVYQPLITLFRSHHVANSILLTNLKLVKMNSFWIYSNRNKWINLDAFLLIFVLNKYNTIFFPCSLFPASIPILRLPNLVQLERQVFRILFLRFIIVPYGTISRTSYNPEIGRSTNRINSNLVD